MNKLSDVSSVEIQKKSLSDQRRKISAYILFFFFLQQRYTEASVGEWSISLLFYIMLMISSTHTRNISLITPHLTTPPSSGWSLAIPLHCNISCRIALYVIPRNPINLIDSGRLWSPQLYDTTNQISCTPHNWGFRFRKCLIVARLLTSTRLLTIDNRLTRFSGNLRKYYHNKIHIPFWITKKKIFSFFLPIIG